MYFTFFNNTTQVCPTVFVYDKTRRTAGSNTSARNTSYATAKLLFMGVLQRTGRKQACECVESKKGKACLGLYISINCSALCMLRIYSKQQSDEQSSCCHKHCCEFWQSRDVETHVTMSESNRSTRYGSRLGSFDQIRRSLLFRSSFSVIEFVFLQLFFHSFF